MKRFTETQKWSDPWFRRLSPNAKLLWQWLLDSCDHAGVISLDLELASFQIGHPMGMDTLSELGERVIKLSDEKVFIPKFIDFQYATLSSDCKAHRPVFASLEKHGLKGYPKGMNTLQDKDKDKDKDKRRDAGNRRFTPPSLKEALSAGAQLMLSREAVEHWWQTREASDWIKANAAGGTMEIRNWRADLAASKSWILDAATKAKGANGGAKMKL
jgi:hypothetical protein